MLKRDARSQIIDHRLRITLWIMARTPGSVYQDLKALAYKRINRPMFPLDKDMEEPDLSARLVPVYGEKSSEFRQKNSEMGAESQQLKNE